MSKLSVKDEFEKLDMVKVFMWLNRNAEKLIKGVSVKSLEGREAKDFVGEMILKVLEGERDWYKARCSFETFLYSCLKGHVGNQLKKIKEHEDMLGFKQDMKYKLVGLDEDGVDDPYYVDNLIERIDNNEVDMFY